MAGGTTHHYLKTHFGYILRRHLGHWLFEDPGGIPPDLDDLQQELSEVGFVGALHRPECRGGIRG